MRVRHSQGEYEVALGNLQEVLRGFADAFIVTDANVARHWLAKPLHPTCTVEPGEASKSLQTYESILAFLHRSGATRSSRVVAVGGGVVGDLAGFAAATYMRGVPLVQVPTSLLAMVDSSVGGKVGLNMPGGKNLVGAFHPPVQVDVCLETLETLPLREFHSGAAEIWKSAAAMDWPLFERLEIKPLAPGDDRLAEIIMHTVDLKRRIVEKDEFETTGLRAVLNFGHTAGHAIEAALGFGTLLHGEAISIGMVSEAAVGEKLGTTPPGTTKRIAQALLAQGLPVALPKLDPESLVAWMHRDKKATPRGLAFALLDGHGSCKLVQGVPDSLVLECLQENI